ncbi:MAG: hypothetical protein NTZ38_01410, partial [Candidatus Taylorbacteria bacterium]|nr:hypothetical protein [Candidatus Taylorbacteria bacterium]
MRITTNKSVAFLVVLLFAIGIFFSLYKLTESPPVWYDEGMYFQTAANLATENIDGMRLSPLTIFHLPS